MNFLKFISIPKLQLFWSFCRSQSNNFVGSDNFLLKENKKRIRKKKRKKKKSTTTTTKEKVRCSKQPAKLTGFRHILGCRKHSKRRDGERKINMDIFNWFLPKKLRLQLQTLKGIENGTMEIDSPQARKLMVFFFFYFFSHQFFFFVVFFLFLIHLFFFLIY